MRWAADTTAGSGLHTWLPTLVGVLITAAAGIVGTVWAKRLSRRLDNATADKTQAETEATQVTTARALVAEIRAMMVDQRNGYESQIGMLRGQNEAQIQSVRAQHQQDMGVFAARIGGLEDREKVLRASFARHRRWDEQVIAILRNSDGSFPDPPPVDFD